MAHQQSSHREQRRTATHPQQQGWHLGPDVMVQYNDQQAQHQLPSSSADATSARSSHRGASTDNTSVESGFGRMFQQYGNGFPEDCSSETFADDSSNMFYTPTQYTGMSGSQAFPLAQTASMPAGPHRGYMPPDIQTSDPQEAVNSGRGSRPHILNEIRQCALQIINTIDTYSHEEFSAEPRRSQHQQTNGSLMYLASLHASLVQLLRKLPLAESQNPAPQLRTLPSHATDYRPTLLGGLLQTTVQTTDPIPADGHLVGILTRYVRSVITGNCVPRTRKRKIRGASDQPTPGKHWCLFACGKSFDNASHLKRHMLRRDPNKLFKPGSCAKFGHRGFFKYHGDAKQHLFKIDEHKKEYSLVRGTRQKDPPVEVKAREDVKLCAVCFRRWECPFKDCEVISNSHDGFYKHVCGHQDNDGVKHKDLKEPFHLMLLRQLDTDLFSFKVTPGHEVSRLIAMSEGNDDHNDDDGEDDGDEDDNDSDNDGYDLGGANSSDDSPQRDAGGSDSHDDNHSDGDTEPDEDMVDGLDSSTYQTGNHFASLPIRLAKAGTAFSHACNIQPPASVENHSGVPFLSIGDRFQTSNDVEDLMSSMDDVYAYVREPEAIPYKAGCREVPVNDVLGLFKMSNKSDEMHNMAAATSRAAEAVRNFTPTSTPSSSFNAVQESASASFESATTVYESNADESLHPTKDSLTDSRHGTALNVRSQEIHDQKSRSEDALQKQHTSEKPLVASESVDS